MTTKDHAKLLGIFHLIQAGLQVFTAVMLLFIYGGVGGFFLANARREEEQIMGGVFLVLAVVVGIIAGFTALLYGYSGWNLFKDKKHSKAWTIVVSVLSLPGIPLGTALGVYGLWFTFGDEGKAYYDGEQSLQNVGNPPPPPNSWQ